METGNNLGAHVEAMDANGRIIGIRDREYLADVAGDNTTLQVHGIAKLRVEVQARDADGNVIGEYGNEYDMSVVGYASLIVTNIFNGNATFPDVTNTDRAISANSACTNAVCVAGTNGTAPAFLNYALNNGTTHTDYKTTNSYCNPLTSVSESGYSFILTSLLTNVSGSPITFAEVGLAVTCDTYQFLLSHDVFSGLIVPAGGALAVIYTMTFT